MDYPSEINMKRTKPIPGGQTLEEYRRVMQRILEGMTMENLDVALFLCKDDIPQGREITSPLQFFKYLEDRDLVSQDNAVYIAEVLHIIKRMDLLKIIPVIKNKRHFEDHFLSYAYTNFSNYRVLTIHLLDELSQKDFEKFRYQCASHLRNRSLEECTNVLMLLRKLEEQDVISDDNYDDLIDILKCVENARPLRMFQRLLDGDDTVAMPLGRQRAGRQQPPQQAAFADRRNVPQMPQMPQRLDQFYSLPHGRLRVEQVSGIPYYDQNHPGAAPIVYNTNQTVPKGGDRAEQYGYATNENQHGGHLSPPVAFINPEKDPVAYAFDEGGGDHGRSMMREISANGNKVFSAEESTPKAIAARNSPHFYQRDSQDYRRFRSMPYQGNSPYQTESSRHYSDTFDYPHMPHRYDTPPPSYSQQMHHSHTYPQNLHQEPEIRPQEVHAVGNHPHTPSFFLPEDGYTNLRAQIPPQSLPVDLGSPHFDPMGPHASLPRPPGYVASPPQPQNKHLLDLRRFNNLSIESLNSTGSDVRCILEKSTENHSEAANRGESLQPSMPGGATSSTSHQEEMDKLKRQNEELHELLKQQKSAGSYKMDKSPVGLCILVDNVNYEKNFNKKEVTRRMELNKNRKNKYHLPAQGLKDRVGSTYDADALEVLFDSFDFKVRRYADLDERGIRKVFKEASDEDHSEFNCFLGIILAHGDNGCVFGVDSFPVQISDLQVEFCADGCPTLANKPKIFIIQACQGKKDMLSLGIPEADIDCDAPQPETLTGRSTPNKADFLLAYSTVPGFVSYRVRGSGTFFIMKLVEVLEKHFETQDLLSMMIMVTNECSKFKEKTQVPMPIPTLRKKVYFHRKQGWVPKVGGQRGRSPNENLPSPTVEDVQSSHEAPSGRRSTSIQQVTGEQYE